MESRFHVCDSSVGCERENWLRHWTKWPEREVFAHPSYVELFLRDGQSARCAILASDSGYVLYPFIYRDLTTETYWKEEDQHGADIVTPYGYGGPYCWNVRDSQQLAAEFWGEFSTWTNANNIVSEFVRFTVFEESLLPYPGHKEVRLKNVIRNLDLDAESLWKDYKYKVRKNVKRAQDKGVRIEVDERGSHLDQFLDIYYATMERRSASQTYFFPRLFFERLCEQIIGQYAFFHAFLGDDIISTELVLLSECNVYSFLGGTDARYFELRPNDMLKHQIILWSKSRNKTNFVLGGGYQDDDGIFQYKQSFAPNSIRFFQVGWRIIDPNLYSHLVDSRNQQRGRADDNPSYFPAYRA
jgi:hypothetical protein